MDAGKARLVAQRLHHVDLGHEAQGDQGLADLQAVLLLVRQRLVELLLVDLAEVEEVLADLHGLARAGTLGQGGTPGPVLSNPGPPSVEWSCARWLHGDGADPARRAGESCRWCRIRSARYRHRGRSPHRPRRADPGLPVCWTESTPPRPIRGQIEARPRRPRTRRK